MRKTSNDSKRRARSTSTSQGVGFFISTPEFAAKLRCGLEARSDKVMIRVLVLFKPFAQGSQVQIVQSNLLPSPRASCFPPPRRMSVEMKL
jgi:hypothetical protein